MLCSTTSQIIEVHVLVTNIRHAEEKKKYSSFFYYLILSLFFPIASFWHILSQALWFCFVSDSKEILNIDLFIKKETKEKNLLHKCVWIKNKSKLKNIQTCVWLHPMIRSHSSIRHMHSDWQSMPKFGKRQGILQSCPKYPGLHPE